MLNKFTTTASEFLRNGISRARAEIPMINWPITIINWTWHIATRAFLVFAVGFFAADILILLAVQHGGGWESLTPALPIQPHEFVMGAKEFLNFKIGSVLMVGISYPILSIMFGGFRLPEVSRKKTLPTATAMMDSQR